MIDREQGPREVDVAVARRRVVGILGFGAGFVVAIGFFAFFPGLPHVIDWGAILVSLGVGAGARWGARRWVGE
ncbi:hypothetical protein [Streptomyces sp. NPDC093111]|uniref:hypothetical protein n=1 Tax=Streptomyces sp. NPDC093111 TaxID=3154978 RepID=UPI003442F90A